MIEKREADYQRAIVGYGDAACSPIDFPTAPTLAVPKALKMAGVEQSDIALWEFNEAFSVVQCAAEKVLGLDRSIVNTRGGAVALGHVGFCSLHHFQSCIALAPFYAPLYGICAPRTEQNTCLPS